MATSRNIDETANVLRAILEPGLVERDERWFAAAEYQLSQKRLRAIRLIKLSGYLVIGVVVTLFLLALFSPKAGSGDIILGFEMLAIPFTALLSAAAMIGYYRGRKIIAKERERMAYINQRTAELEATEEA